MARVKLSDIVSISKLSWSPSRSISAEVNHYSIPNFDGGAPRIEAASTIKSNKFLITQPCILISKLNPGDPRVWLIEELRPGISVASSEFVVLVLKTLAELTHVYFLLKSPQVTRRLSELATGTSNSHQRVSPYEIINLELEWLESQSARKKSAAILTNVEKKIRLNSEIAKTLEDVAQTIFKSWFIDFDPVYAKARGERPHGVDAATLDLFSDSFEDSSFGQIPMGWRIGKLADLVACVKKKILPGAATLELPYVPIDRISSKSLFLHDVAPSESAQSSLITFEKGDILFGAMRPYFHKVCSAPFDGVTRTTTFVLRPRNFRCFALMALFQESTIEFATTHSQGSTIPYAVWEKGLAEMPIVLAPNQLAQRFEALVGPMLDYAESLIAQNQTLASIRDGLLPRLISGELEIPEELLGE